MALRDGPDDAILYGAWRRFCEQLSAAGEFAFKDLNPQAPVYRVDALRFLTQNLGQAFDLALETRDTRYPALHTLCNPTRKLGGDCADFLYQQAWIDGRSRYRITGDRGTARFLTITVQGARPEGPGVLHEPFGDLPESALSGADIETQPDGSFEIHIGGDPRPRNWLPTTSDSRKIFVRQGFDRWDERPSRMRIERIDMASPKPLPDVATMVEAIEWAGGFVTGLMSDWPEYAFRYGGVDAGRPNEFPHIEADDADALRGRSAVNMHWVLKPDEALVIEFPAHDGLWMLTNMGVFFNSMDYLYRPVSYTPSRTEVDRDGIVRLVLAHDDPGIHNWIDTQGFERGNLTYRHMLEGTPVLPRTRVVTRARLDAALPPDTARVTSAQRSAQLLERFTGVRSRYEI